MEEKNPLILVDGTQYLFRAFNGSPEMYTSRGFPTHAIRGVVSMLQRVVRQYPEATVVAIFDAPGKTFRDDLYPEYKANRPPMDEDMRVQIEPIYEFVHAMGLPLLVVPNVEADDVMGTLAREATEKERPLYIASSDKDLAQLVNDYVLQFDSWGNQIGDNLLDRDGVFGKFEVKPEQIIDYLALMGDKVDNIPGIPGVGKKTAAKWLQEHGDLDTVIANADQVKGKVGERLREHMHVLPLSRKLATINCHVELEHSIDTLKHQEINADRIFELCTKYEFRTLRTQFEEDLNQTTELATQPSDEGPTLDIHDLTTREDLESCIQNIESKGEYALYLMTDGEGLFNHAVCGLALSHESDKVAYMSLVDRGLAEEGSRLSASEAMQTLKPLFENEAVTLIAHDVKTLRHTLASFDINLRNRVHDVMLQSYVLNSVGHGQHQLKGITGAILEQSIPDEVDLLGNGRKRIAIEEVDPTTLRSFVARQATTVLALHTAMYERLSNKEALLGIYETIELPLEPYLCDMERHGAIVAPSVLNDLNDELEVRKNQLTQDAYELAKHEFNLASPKQLEVVLYDEIGLQAPSKSKSGSRSTKEEILKGLVGVHPLPQVILDFRATTKLMSTYIAGLLREINADTERIHTTFSQAIASTGRLASINPNLQNIPIRTADGRRVREAFVAPEGHVLLTVDYSQIELRVMAHITDDPGLTEAFTNQIDVHQATAAEVFQVPLDQVDDDLRRKAKAINFGLMYGMSAFGLARELGFTRSQAKSFIDTYFTHYPKVQDYVTTTTATAKEKGYVETINGRRIYLKDINAKNPMRRQAAERLAINAPVQGSAADIIKLASIRVGDWLKETDVDCYMILQVHDELVFEVANEDLEQAKTHITELMRSAAQLNVPLEVDVGSATDWSAAHS